MFFLCGKCNKNLTLSLHFNSDFILTGILRFITLFSHLVSFSFFKNNLFKMFFFDVFFSFVTFLKLVCNYFRMFISNVMLYYVIFYVCLDEFSLFFFSFCFLSCF